MKITNLAIAFVIIMFPYFFYNEMKIDYLNRVQEIELRYDTTIDSAVQDATKMLFTNEQQEYEAKYKSTKSFRANKENALEAFLNTMAINFRVIDDPIALGTLMAYIPAIVVVDYDGYYLYVVKEYQNVNGETEMKHVWLPKKPYSYSDNELNSLSFTLDDYVVAYDKDSNTWHEGVTEDIKDDVSIPLLDDPLLFDSVRRTTIVQSIQKDLEYFINEHNTYAARYGITYTFTLPVISQEEWTNTIDDIGFLSFIQGIPLGPYEYNNYAFGGSKMAKIPEIYGTTINNIKYAYRSDCSFSYIVEETFTTQKEAAEEGYFPLSCNNN